MTVTELKCKYVGPKDDHEEFLVYSEGKPKLIHTQIFPKEMFQQYPLEEGSYHHLTITLGLGVKHVRFDKSYQDMSYIFDKKAN